MQTIDLHKVLCCPLTSSVQVSYLPQWLPCIYTLPEGRWAALARCTCLLVWLCEQPSSLICRRMSSRTMSTLAALTARARAVMTPTLDLMTPGLLLGTARVMGRRLALRMSP